MQGIPFSKCARGGQILFRTLLRTTLSPKYFLSIGGHVRQLTTTTVDCCVLKSGKKPLNRLLLLEPALKLLARRHFSKIPQDFCGKNTLEKLRQRDCVPKSYTLIYRTSFPNYLMFSQLIVFLAFGATITTALIMTLTDELTEEEKKVVRKKEQENKKTSFLGHNEIDEAISKYREELGVKPDPSKPVLDDFFDNGPGPILVMTITLIALVVGLVRIQKLLPVRIYANQKNHCIAVMYGHILPGRITCHEFVAGTVVPSAKRMKLDFFSNSLFEDGTGKNMILMDQFFRSPADFNRILGLQEEFTTEEDIARRQRRN